ncbi:phage baseplate assembly protein [Dyella caseinilytica]|uniref:Phage baseplate assembly protein V n=1 Tax=Dyella caseinilytica TaxID=1849581 RepID=A0ABX7GY56_9GAMM|nr:phage baseplate assembly protein [Dyella caseinilytica]QRN55260.1 hypothetical protein ISN74_08005 [Dyella caseinilytica]
MASNWLKLWVQGNLGKLATNRARNEIQSTGRCLPCSVVGVNGALVTVKFEVNSKPWTLPQITIPIAESQWIRAPIQIGDKGITIPADVLIGNISGLGVGVPTMARPGNLSALSFLPISSKNFSPVNTNAAFVSGPQGVVLQTEDGSVSLTLSETGFVFKLGTQTFTFNASGLTSSVALQVNSTINATNDIKAGTISLQNHVHSGVQSGGSNTGPATG